MKNIISFVSMAPSFLQSIVRNVPFYVNYDLTWQCNLKCKHCYFFSSTSELKNKRMELSDEEWIKVFKYHRNLGTKIAILTGGEPTLRMDVIREAIKIFPSVQVVSNGVMKLPRFNGYKQPKYWVSIDGTKDNGASGLVFLLYTDYPNSPLLLKGNILKKTIKDILKVMGEYGNFIFYSKKMLEVYLSKEFVPYCIFKTGQIKSFYPDGKQKFCVMGNSPLLCENCGCVVPIAAYALFRKFDSGTVDKARKLFNFK
ncbi:MAG: radical SAM protein [Promethearchaeota archaeon]